MKNSTPYKKVVAAPETVQPQLEENEFKRNRIKNALDRDLRVAGNTLDVSVRGEEAVLRGRLPSSTAKMAAEFDVWAIRGIGLVRNEIQVDEPDEEPLLDTAQLQEKAIQLITAEPDLVGTEVEITATPAKLILTGYVSTREQEQKIHGIALKVPGVLEVINKISVIPSHDEEDQRIGHEINERLYKSIDIDVSTVDVSVEHGQVKLSGYVETSDDLKIAEEIARMSGARDVSLDLTVLEEQNK